MGVYGRRNPSDSNPNPEIICTKVFGPSELYAKSQFWKINREQHKLKRAAGEILRVREVFEKNTKTVKAYGIYFHYRDNTAFRNAFKEFRCTSLKNARLNYITKWPVDKKLTKNQSKLSEHKSWEAEISGPETQESEDSVTHADLNIHSGAKELDTVMSVSTKKLPPTDQSLSRANN